MTMTTPSDIAQPILSRELSMESPQESDASAVGSTGRRRAQRHLSVRQARETRTKEDAMRKSPNDARVHARVREFMSSKIFQGFASLVLILAL